MDSVVIIFYYATMIAGDATDSRDRCRAGNKDMCAACGIRNGGKREKTFRDGLNGGAVR